MADYRASLGRGLLVGAGAAALWAIARYYGRTTEAKLIDWDWVTRVAERASGPDGALSVAEKAALQPAYELLVRDLEEPIAAYTATRLPLGETAIQVMDRRDWIRANAANFRELFQPIEDFYRESQSRDGLDLLGLGVVGRATLSFQIGLLLGYLARRVLGQYDVSLLGREPLSPGKLYFVEPNIRLLQRSFGVPGDELRRWIALHEATHAHEFEVHPWVRAYLKRTLQGYLQLVVEDLRGSSGGLAGAMFSRLWENVRAGRNLVDALMTPQQRHYVSRLQALMSLAEGYSNHVMNVVGRRVLPHFEQIRARVEARQRQRSPAEDLFLRLTGLKLKLEQYALGEAFVDRVVAERGVAFVNLAWERAEHLPAEDEIRHPDRWVARMEAAVAGNGGSV